MGLTSAAAIMMILPIIAIFLILQRRFIDGLTQAASKDDLRVTAYVVLAPRASWLEPSGFNSGSSPGVTVPTILHDKILATLYAAAHRRRLRRPRRRQTSRPDPRPLRRITDFVEPWDGPSLIV